MPQSANTTILGLYLGITAKSPEEGVLRLLIELGAQFVGADEGSLLVWDADQSELVFAMTLGSGESEKNLIGQRVPLGEGITGLAAQTREVQVGAPTLGVEQAVAPRSVLAAPMLVVDDLAGVITAVSFAPNKYFSAADALLYGRLASVAGVVIEQRRRLAAVEAVLSGAPLPPSTREDERLSHEIVEACTALVRKRPSAKAHIRRLLVDIESLVGE